MKTEKVNNANNFPLAKSVNKMQIINETRDFLGSIVHWPTVAAPL